jgi:hypothetical protein
MAYAHDDSLLSAATLVSTRPSGRLLERLQAEVSSAAVMQRKARVIRDLALMCVPPKRWFYYLMCVKGNGPNGVAPHPRLRGVRATGKGAASAAGR